MLIPIGGNIQSILVNPALMAALLHYLDGRSGELVGSMDAGVVA